MPQCSVVRAAGHVLGVFSFTDGFVRSRAETPRKMPISETQVLAMCEHLERQGDPEEANLLLDRYLALLG